MKNIIFVLLVLLCSNLLSTQGYLGIRVRVDATPASVLKGANLKHGILITEIVPGSPADIAGLKVNDIIYQIDEKKIQNETDLENIIVKCQPSDVITIHLANRQQHQTRRVTLSNSDTLYRELYIYNFIENPYLFMGIQIETISASLARLLKLEKGMVITDVRDQSIASMQGLETGDIIISINNTPTNDEKTLSEALIRGLQNQPMHFSIWRNSQTITKQIDLSNNVTHQNAKTNEVFIIGPDLFDIELYSYSRDRINNILNKPKSEREQDIDRLEQEIFRLRQNK